MTRTAPSCGAVPFKRGRCCSPAAAVEPPLLLSASTARVKPHTQAAAPHRWAHFRTPHVTQATLAMIDAAKTRQFVTLNAFSTNAFRVCGIL